MTVSPIKLRTTRNREARPVLGAPHLVLVTIGGRTEAINAGLEETQATLRKMHRQPSPIIWRALGVEA